MLKAAAERHAGGVYGGAGMEAHMTVIGLDPNNHPTSTNPEVFTFSGSQ